MGNKKVETKQKRTTKKNRKCCVWKETHLEKFGESTPITVRNTKRKKKCFRIRPCKRIECISCRKKRRDYFLGRGVLHANKLGLDRHVTVSLPSDSKQDAWMKLSTLTTVISKKLVNRIGFFMRVVSIGRNKRTPHGHFLIRSEWIERFKKLAEKALPSSIVFIDENLVYDLPGLLGYWYDRNFVHTSLDDEKIKGIRLMSGTRGMTYSYPSSKNWKELVKLREAIQ